MRTTLVTLASALLFSSFTYASPLQPVSRRDAALIPGYGYEGCFTEATQGRALTGSSFYDDYMTVEKCAAACSNFAFFGVEHVLTSHILKHRKLTSNIRYGRECFCGGALSAGSVAASETDCSFRCPGNADQTCGAGNRKFFFLQWDILSQLWSHEIYQLHP